MKRNIQSPDLFNLENQRKLKTEGSFVEHGFYQTSFKKDNTTKKKLGGNNHVRSIQTQNNFFDKFSANGSNFNTIVHHSKMPISKKNQVSKTPKNKKSVSLKNKQKRVNTQ